ncbi:uncharacterized protein [Nicotiana sylvestris]|uniref:uncharacterized protein n=1 Tax=Nicotiana sylvestris TaxID=4096 RepID=UPI00388C4580
MSEVNDFRHYINTCNLTDLGFKGSIFTWWNGRAEDDCIFKILNRCLANLELQQMLSTLEVTHLSKIGSDHRPMMLTDVVKQNWTVDFAGDTFIMFNHKLKRLKKALSAWSRATYRDIFKKIASLEEVVLVHEAEFERNPTYQNRERLQKVQAELIRYLDLEEEFWKQKSGTTWFQDGDRNTIFFHAQVNGRRK